MNTVHLVINSENGSIYGAFQDEQQAIDFRNSGPNLFVSSIEVHPSIDYPAAARSIALWLSEFKNEDLPYPEMIAECARQASREIYHLRQQLQSGKADTESVVDIFALIPTDNELEDMLMDGYAKTDKNKERVRVGKVVRNIIAERLKVIQTPNK